ncbi:MAG: ParB/RepB/Spo0J family partition protein [Firmicutes bacterium]|nr:ParB/RepB/Spo0J family partition protein [Bacillota bacterium]MCL1953984.1 ParB/RepB/Spo0J family partition protein [Bacillota bacterium]
MMRKGLGRGLGALIGDFDNNQLQSAETKKIETKQLLGETSFELSLNDIVPNNQQPRKIFDRDLLIELRDSIAEHGVVTPILVVKQNDKYMIIAGERRYRACLELGLEKVPCIIKDYSPQKVKEISLVDNIIRDDLNPIDISSYLNQLIEEFGYTQEQLSKTVGMSRPQITNLLRLNNLAPVVKDWVMQKLLTFGQAKILLSITNHERQMSIAKKCISDGLSVKSLELLVNNINSDKDNKKNTNAVTNEQNELQQIADRFSSTFETKVSFKGNDKKGKIVLEYSSKADLEKFSVMIGLLETMN